MAISLVLTGRSGYRTVHMHSLTGGFLSRVFAPKDRVRIEIEDIAFGGSGVGRIENQVVFVPFTADGDVLEAEVTKVKKRYLFAKMRELLHPSPYRIAPRCPAFQSCGGCHYQHIDYAHELQIKKRQIVSVFERIGGLVPPPFGDVIPSPKMYQYRQKAEFHRTGDANGLVSTGFMGADDKTLIDIDRCELVEESINREYGRVKKYDAMRKIEDERMIFWSRVGYKTDEYITREVNNRTLKVPYRGFFQANAALVGRLVDSVVGACRPLNGATVFDCYCGSGLFSLFLASEAKCVVGCDTNAAAVACAEANLEANGYSNARFYAGKAENISDIISEETFSAISIVVLDPPRIGCSPETLTEIARLAPEKIIYVSCNPATQARDIRRLADFRYELDALCAFDMFPRTKHVEVIAVLRPAKGQVRK